MTLWEVAFSHFQRISTLFLIFITRNLVNNDNTRQRMRNFFRNQRSGKNETRTDIIIKT